MRSWVAMATVHKQVLIDRPAEAMFVLVDHCERYPEFLPWCGGAEVHERTQTVTDATLKVDFHGIKTHFRTANAKNPPFEMTIALKEGPFRHLYGHWRFQPLGTLGCKIEFELHYEFASKLLEKALGPVFHKIAQTFVDAFVARAQQMTPEEWQALTEREQSHG
ncbi:type II toxin-antitoxin system RatA family toxin [Hydrogenophilus islandicus]